MIVKTMTLCSDFPPMRVEKKSYPLKTKAYRRDHNPETIASDSTVGSREKRGQQNNRPTTLGKSFFAFEVEITQMICRHNERT